MPVPVVLGNVRNTEPTPVVADRNYNSGNTTTRRTNPGTNALGR